MNRVTAQSIERLSGAVGQVYRIDRVFWKIGAEAELSDNRPFQIVIAVDAHRVSVHRPAVRNARQGRNFPGHEVLSGLGRLLKRLLHCRIESVKVEALAGLDADPPQL